MEKDVSTYPNPRITPEEYLELERKAETKSEYLDGEMIAMPGVTREHAQIVLNIATELNSQFEERPCEVYVSDLRTKVVRTECYMYPDIVAVCGASQCDDEHFDNLINPELIIEVLSESTESYDRGIKFAHYRRIDSLREYALVSQWESRVESYHRQDDNTWLYSETTDIEGSIQLVSVTCRLSMSRIYRKVDFEVARAKRRKRPTVL